MTTRIQHEMNGANITQVMCAKEAGVGVDVFRSASKGERGPIALIAAMEAMKRCADKKRRTASRPIQRQPRSYGKCEACGKSVGEDDWVINGKGQMAHYGATHGDKCFRKLRGLT